VGGVGGTEVCRAAEGIGWDERMLKMGDPPKGREGDRRATCSNGSVENDVVKVSAGYSLDWT
jgi:hypothetical protein